MHGYMEELYAECLLWFHGFNTNEAYQSLLNEYFLNNEQSSILLELEECSSNLLNTRGRFMRYWNYECSDFNPDAFGKRLFKSLEKVYKSNKFKIDEFAKKCNKLWFDFPSNLSQVEPFWTLIYADECLTWDDEAQTRELYERAFAFYTL